MDNEFELYRLAAKGLCDQDIRLTLPGHLCWQHQKFKVGRRMDGEGEVRWAQISSTAFPRRQGQQRL